MLRAALRLRLQPSTAFTRLRRKRALPWIVLISKATGCHRKHHQTNSKAEARESRYECAFLKTTCFVASRTKKANSIERRRCLAGQGAQLGKYFPAVLHQLRTRSHKPSSLETPTTNHNNTRLIEEGPLAMGAARTRPRHTQNQTPITNARATARECHMTDHPLTRLRQHSVQSKRSEQYRRREHSNQRKQKQILPNQLRSAIRPGATFHHLSDAGNIPERGCAQLH